MARLYKIIKQIEYLYKIKLLDSIIIYSVLLPDKLQKAANVPLLGQ